MSQATQAERAALAADGFVRAPGVLSASTVAAIAPIVDEVGRASAQRATPMTARTVYEQAFLQVANVWQRRADIRPLVAGPGRAGAGRCYRASQTMPPRLVPRSSSMGSCLSMWPIRPL